MTDPASLAISICALSFTICSFAWQHWRKVDSLVCSVVGNECSPNSLVRFQFSFANLGTHPALLRDVCVRLYMQPDLHGHYLEATVTVQSQLPQVIKAGEMVSVTIESNWTDTFLCLASKAAENRGRKAPELFFQVSANAWNPKGKRLSTQEAIGILQFKEEGNGWGFSVPDKKTFQLENSMNLA